MSGLSTESDLNVCLFFKAERKRLKISQKQIAEYLGMSEKQVSRWESSVAIPTDKLALLAALGFDLLYIITGTRSQPVESTLSRRETAMLDNFRHCREEDQAAIERVALNAAAAKGFAKVENG